MAPVWTDTFSFIAGAVRFRDLAYLAISDDSVDSQEYPHAVFLVWDNGNWGECGRVPWIASSFAVCQIPIEQGIALGEMGNVVLMGSGDLHNEQVADGPDEPLRRGVLRRVRGIAGKAYAAGMNRQVYRRDGRDQWTCIDQDMRRPTGEVVGFEGIDGYAADDIYAGGWRGEIWHFDGKNWRAIDSPTNRILTNLVCGGDGLVYACGRIGLLVRGRGDAWEVIEHGQVRDDFWGLAWFQNHLYVAGSRRLFRLEGDELVRVRMDNDLVDTFYHLSAADGVLWSIGPKDVLAFDGAQWTRIDGP